MPADDGAQATTSPRVLRVRGDHVRFLLVGAYNTGFGYAVFAGLHLLFPDLHYIAVLLASHVVSVLNAFIGYRLVVFKVRGSVLRDLFRFWLVYLVSLSFNLVALPLLVEQAELPVLLAQALVVVVVVVTSWFGHSRFSFRRDAPEEKVVV